MDLAKKGIPQIETMLKDGFLFERDGYLFTSPHFPVAERDEKFRRMKNFESTKNALIVTGLPKTGSHLTMSILDSLGFERAEDLGDQNGITAMPFDFQHKLVAFDRMEEKLKSSSKFLILPHCHLYANFFPDDFKGKIIHVTRDPRAVITSAWHFMTKLPHYNHYFDTWGFKNINDFAAHEARGEMYWGDIVEFDNSWKEYSKRNPNVDIIFLKFEDIVSNKARAVQQIAEFLEMKEFNVESVVANSTLDATRDRRQKIYQSNNAQFKEGKCYRKGKSNAWEEELSIEVQQMYLEKYPHLE